MNMIVALCRKRGIGFQNRIPWTFKQDLQYFRDMTIGNGNNAVIMGRKTWWSLPDSYMPLPKRTNIILSSRAAMQKEKQENTHVFPNIEDAKQFCHDKKFDQTWIIGGQSIYRQCLHDPDVQHLYITNIDRNYICDTWFPQYEGEFKLQSMATTQEKGTVLQFQTWQRIAKTERV